MASKDTFNKLYKFHMYAGLFVAVHFLILSVTGFTLLFKNDDSEKPVKTLSAAEIANGYDNVFRDLQKTYPDDRILALFPDDHNPQFLKGRLGENGARSLRHSRRTTHDLTTGMARPVPKTEKGFFEFVLELHRELFLGNIGKIYIGLVGAIYVFLLMSGFFIYGRFMKGRKMGERRTGPIGSSMDWHKFMGITTFGWSLVVGATGTLLSFNSYLLKLFQWQSLNHLAAQYKDAVSEMNPAIFKDVISSVFTYRPDAFISYISFPGSEYGIAGHFLVLVESTTASAKSLTELIVVNATTGTLTEVVTLPFYLKILLLSEPLHFGNYGGVFLKLLWGTFTLGSLLVVLMGVTSYVLKRRRTKTLEKLNTSRTHTTWSARNPRLAGLGVAVVIWCSLCGALFGSSSFTWISISGLLIPVFLFAWKGGLRV